MEKDVLCGERSLRGSASEARAIRLHGVVAGVMLIAIDHIGHGEAVAGSAGFPQFEPTRPARQEGEGHEKGENRPAVLARDHRQRDTRPARRLQAGALAASGRSEATAERRDSIAELFRFFE